jgi:hypothetical protein
MYAVDMMMRTVPVEQGSCILHAWLLLMLLNVDPAL